METVFQTVPRLFFRIHFSERSSPHKTKTKSHP
nr:MAG TPA_asm: hypothetical protein [Caudoviricetes sp.]